MGQFGSIGGPEEEIEVIRTPILILVLGIVLVAPLSAHAYTLIDSYNLNDPWAGNQYVWSATQVALKYIPESTYYLNRVEFFTGNEKNDVTIALRPDNSSYPDTTILASGMYDSIGETASWQGATFNTPYQVSAGTTYWITWYNTSGLYMPRSSGTTHLYLWHSDSNIDHYYTAYNGGGFKTKFFSGENNENVAPEPASIALLGLGLLGIFRIKKNRG